MPIKRSGKPTVSERVVSGEGPLTKAQRKAHHAIQDTARDLVQGRPEDLRTAGQPKQPPRHLKSVE